MTSYKDKARNELDERLITLRDSLLTEGENVVAQEEGDQGQGIILTNSRIIVLKVGFAATGTSQGKLVGSFPLSEITDVSVRKGPLGAVIQVRTQDRQPADPGTRPDNVVVFTGSQRIKKCDAIAAKIEAVLGKPVHRTEATEQKPENEADAQQKDVEAAKVSERLNGEEQTTANTDLEPAAADRPDEAVKAARPRRETTTLADQIFAEMTGQDSVSEGPVTAAPRARGRSLKTDAAPAVPPQAAVSPPASIPPAADDPSAAAQPSVPRYGPNPNIPKPVKVRATGLGKATVVLVGLAAAMLVGISVTAPLRDPATKPSVEIRPVELSRNLQVLLRQQADVKQYRAKVVEIIEPVNQMLARLDAAVRSGNVGAIAAAVSANPAEEGWQKLTEMPAPAGLASAKENLTSGLFVTKTVTARLASELRTPSGVSVNHALARIAEARSLFNKGLAAIAQMQAQLEREAAQCQQRSKAGRE